jgi:single-strand DNA-binding protein
MTADPELKNTPSGVSVCSFSIGVNRRFSKDSEQKTDFINIVAWRNTAEFVAKYFRKGNAICICGSLQTRTWTDNNGNKRYATEVIADEASFVESKKETAADIPEYSPTTPAAAPKFEEISVDDDLPF